MHRPENALLHRLPPAARQQLLDHCEPFELVLSAELSVRGKPLEYAHFPIEGFLSLVIDVDSHPPLEVGMVGAEAMLGSELILGLAATPWRALVQGAGSSWRIGAHELRAQITEIPALETLLQACLLARLHQQTLAAACQRYHLIAPRLARWLLMSQDRSQSEHFHVTQEFMALMLGVRRVGVTEAASHFQDDGLITYHRGELTVLDRPALEAEACSCYAADKQIYQRLMKAQR
ncbi:Crp/Fnr family transcriptional regulator [Acidovorax sp. Root275]|uniref:Crp/Fnr family transcriptional regulator n=1 Tax=unclassified Acidovorax TaxID=2684926 RepID=UPI00070CE31D|nr:MULTISPECIES: Crp/Fnr family transcriptional regulator [unclassified Acidovorax]KRD25303.1 Crp/Fnr family transcriptional regulator [Acidovorax sp. Root267]KRD55950.1 Crp/Fnr family transcriptional regulator [Acidovorax sp. Root275]